MTKSYFDENLKTIRPLLDELNQNFSGWPVVSVIAALGCVMDFSLFQLESSNEELPIIIKDIRKKLENLNSFLMNEIKLLPPHPNKDEKIH